MHGFLYQRYRTASAPDGAGPTVTEVAVDIWIGVECHTWSLPSTSNPNAFGVTLTPWRPDVSVVRAYQLLEHTSY